MYYYVELYSDPRHSRYLDIEEFHAAFSDRPDCVRKSNASYWWTIGDFSIRIQGIRCDKRGNYAIDDDSQFKSINLIAVDLPHGSESFHEEEIREFVSAIGVKLSWEINWREE